MARFTSSRLILFLIIALLLAACSNQPVLQPAAPGYPPPVGRVSSSPHPAQVVAYPTTLSEPYPAPTYAAPPTVQATSAPDAQEPAPQDVIAQLVKHLSTEPLLSGRQLCQADHPSALYSAESVDQHYQSFTYLYETLIFVSCVVNTQSNTFFTAGRGFAVEYAWSPSDDYLLVNEQALHPRTYVINMTTGVTVELPVKAVWGATFHDPNPISVAPDGAWSPTTSSSGMAWSPDGTRLAINTKNSVYLFQTTNLWQEGGDIAIERVIVVPLINRPTWSADGKFLFSTEVINNDDGKLHPTSMYRYQNVRINTYTGVIQKLAN